jgi:molecular chaperone GrpE (heat shock protein)
MDNAKEAKTAPDPEESRPDGAQTESCDQESPEVRAAARAVEEAKARLREARACYAGVREEARAKLEQVRETRIGDLIDGILAFVRKHPGPGVIVALLAGIFLGRKFRW